MIQYNPKEWFSLIFQFHKSDTFRQMFWVMLLFSIITLLIVYAEIHFKQLHVFSNSIQIHSLIGFVISLLLVFRTNSAYDRWWEGRKQWGSLVNNCRNIAIKINAILPQDLTQERIFFRKMIPSYVIAMKEHLRKGVKKNQLNIENIISNQELYNSTHVPNLIASKMYEKIHHLYRLHYVSGDQLITIDKELKSLTDIIGACERIKNTPIPFS